MGSKATGAMSGAAQGAMAGSAMGPYGALFGGLAGGLGGYFGTPDDIKNTPAPTPTNYFGMNGSAMVWNPATGGYTSLDPRMAGADQGALFKYQQMMDALTGGTGSVQASAKAEAERLSAQIKDPNTPAALKAELQGRLNQVNQTARQVGDWHNPLGQIGVTDPNRQLEFQKQTGTVQDYLRNTLDRGMDARQLGETKALAARGLGSSSNAQYGGQQRAQDYGIATGQNAITANDYLRQLQAADEAKKYQMFGLAQGSAGQIEGKQLSQEQLALNQMMMGMGAGQQYGMQKDAWNRQGAAVNAANAGQSAQQWRDTLGAAMGGLSNSGLGTQAGFDWKKFGAGASGALTGTSPNLWNQVKTPQGGGYSPTFNWGSPSGWAQPQQINNGFQGNLTGQQPTWGSYQPGTFGSTPQFNYATSTK